MSKKKGQFVKGGSDSTDGDLSKALDIAHWGDLANSPTLGLVSQLWACGKGLPDGLTEKQIAECRGAEADATAALGKRVAEAIKREDEQTLADIVRVVKLLATLGGKPVDPERALVIGLFALLDDYNNRLVGKDVRKIKGLERSARQKWTLNINGSRIEALVAANGKLAPTVTTFLRWAKARKVALSRFTIPRIQAQPVDGLWRAKRVGTGKSRRTADCVTTFRFMVVESDIAEPDLWLRALVQMRLPIAAIYHSGGRSIHALARIDAQSREQWEARVAPLKPGLVALGADPASLTSVRLTRLPNAHRGTRKQELLYLNPEPFPEPIYAHYQ